MEPRDTSSSSAAAAPRRQTIEYKFLRQNTYHEVPKMRFSVTVYLIFFQAAFIALYAFFARYNIECDNGHCVGVDSRQYAMFMDVHSMMFIGFGFLMTFLKRYGYGSVGFNFLIAAYALEWALLVRGWLDTSSSGGVFKISPVNLLVADLSTAAVLISFGAVVGKASLSQLVIMTTIEIVLQSVNEFIGLHYLLAYDIGESIYVHVFGAYFGLAVAKVLQRTNKGIESTKESSHYHSDLFSMIGTVFLWIYWPSFNAATAVEEGQVRSVVNTYLAIASSCIITYVVSMFVGKGRLSMVHIQNATLAGGVAVGAIADMPIQPYGAMIIGSIAGVISTLGYHFLTPKLNQGVLHDTCGVNNLHGMPGLVSGIASAVFAAIVTPESFDRAERLYVFYPSRTPTTNSTEFQNNSLADTKFAPGGLGRTGMAQGGFQLASLCMTLGIALVGGILTGYLMKLPIFEQIEEVEEMFDDEPHWVTPEDYSLKLTEVRVQQRNGAGGDDEEMKNLSTGQV